MGLTLVLLLLLCVISVMTIVCAFYLVQLLKRLSVTIDLAEELFNNRHAQLMRILSNLESITGSAKNLVFGATDAVNSVVALPRKIQFFGQQFMRQIWERPLRRLTERKVS